MANKNNQNAQQQAVMPNGARILLGTDNNYHWYDISGNYIRVATPQEVQAHQMQQQAAPAVAPVAAMPQAAQQIAPQMQQAPTQMQPQVAPAAPAMVAPVIVQAPAEEKEEGGFFSDYVIPVAKYGACVAVGCMIYKHFFCDDNAPSSSVEGMAFADRI